MRLWKASITVRNSLAGRRATHKHQHRLRASSALGARLAVGVFAGDRLTLLCGELAEFREVVFDFPAFVSHVHRSRLVR
jgi:hypothetical protein